MKGREEAEGSADAVGEAVAQAAEAEGVPKVEEEEGGAARSVWREADCCLSERGGEGWGGADEDEEEEETLRRGGGGGSECVGGEGACRTVCVRPCCACGGGKTEEPEARNEEAPEALAS